MAPGGKAPTRTRHRPQTILVVCGVALAVWLVARLGLGAIAESFARLSWRLAVLIVFPCTIFKLFDTLGWAFTFPIDRASLWTLAKARVVGQAINATTPTGTLGGDAAKAWLLRGEVPTHETLTSLIVVKTTMTAAQGLFLLLGVVIARTTVASDTFLLRAMEWLLALEVAAVVGFVAVQTTGAIARLHRLAVRFGVLRAAHVADAAGALDRTLARFYRRQPGRLGLSVACNFLGWVGSAAEAWVILAWLGTPVSWPTALVIEAFATGIRFATFFVPAQVGFIEGGLVGTFVALGLAAEAGLAFSLVRRVREIAWITIGFLLAGASTRRRIAVPAGGA